MGMPLSSLQRLFLMAYDPNAPNSLATLLRSLQTTFEAGDDCKTEAHNFLGTTRTAGANVLALEVKAFRAEPSAAKLEAMWYTLDATREQMKVDGYLPANAFTGGGASS